MKPTRAEALAAGELYYFTGKECPHGHVAKRNTKSGVCYECLTIARRNYMRKLREEQPERVKKQKAGHYERRKEHIIARVRRRYRAEPEKHREAARVYAKEHRVEARNRAKNWRVANPEWKRELDAKFYRENRGLVNSYKAQYRAARLQATPIWLTKEHRKAIVAFYMAAKKLSEGTGIEHEVDHIVPLQGKTVCGLHAPWNLRVIPQTENNARSRIWDVEQDFEAV
jgi:hypothetical protein